MTVTETVIRPSRGRGAPDLSELWAYRELLYFLTWRDLKVRYKQTLLGVSWAVLQPVLIMVVFSLFFGRLAGIPSDGIPYPVFAYIGLLPWLFFANSLQFSANSLVANSALITKVYFPRLLIAIAPTIAGLADFGLAFVVLIAMMLVYGMAFGVAAVLVLPLLLLALITALGVGMLLSALNVRYRDVRYVVPFLTQLWLFATPVVYPASLLDPPWRTLYGLNPMAGVVEGFRWALAGSGEAPGPMLAVSTAVGIGLLVWGAVYFGRTERTFADVV